MKRYPKTISILLLLLSCSIGIGQEKKSNGDNYFFQYEYRQAILAYEAERLTQPLTAQQQLNLADSYFKTNAFDKASDLYASLYENDSLMTGHHFNKWLQSLSKNSKKGRVNELLAQKPEYLSRELMENAEFNTALLQSEIASTEPDYQIFNAASNSAQSDFSPAFYRNAVLFSSGRVQNTKKRNRAGNGFLNIFVSGIRPDGQLAQPITFEGIPSSNFHKATPYYSAGLQSVFFVTSNSENGELLFDENGKNALSIAKQREGGTLQFLFRDLSTSFYYPFYDEGTERLYFAANFEDGYGGTDLYYVSTNNGQIMSAPVNLGPRINSPGNEISPFIFENSLYFASDVFYGLGGMDVYKSNIESRDAFSIPINLGEGINSAEDDFGLIMRNEGDGLLGYFASNRSGGKGDDDVYGFKLDEKPGLKTLTLRGIVSKSNRSSEKIPQALVRLKDSQGNILARTTTDDEGAYRIEIPWQESVTVESAKNRFSTYSQVYDEDELTSFEGQDFNISLAAYDDLVEEKEGQTVVKLKDFFFNTGQTSLIPEITAELDKVVQFNKDFPSVQFRIETYTDSRGGSSTNFRLTQNRSDAIKSYLIEKGVPSSNILYSIGYGEEKILNNCTNGVYCLEILHKKNQRSLIVVLNDNVLFE
ncbi:OmpA family protein [Flagellimonas allohymeniacidonis]|uniref:OmpA family protein n=1 Tax=Flagellimonas allohymeniacidonis TaxID=2517819 RepID=A0A4Q8QD41_9FLAO|nr:OmpA family protein [Allomuricauda hymeniacidonis]TAI47008.1 OmpA family protein [Allomuricauda hymeniacidonis]